MKQSVGRRVRRRRRMLALLVLVLILFVQCGKLTLRSDAGIRAPMSLVAFLRGGPLWGISSRNALLMDLQSGEVLALKSADERRAPASLTKMMTILLAVEILPDLQQPVTLPEDIYAQIYAEDASMAGFQPEETVTVTELLEGHYTEEKQRFTREETEDLIRKALTFSVEPVERRQERTRKNLPVYLVCCIVGIMGALAVWGFGYADTEGALALLILSVIFGVTYGAYSMFWMTETLPRYYDENHICSFAQGAFHIHIPGVYYNNRNWPHILRALRGWSMVSMVLVPPCTAGTTLLERSSGQQMWGIVLVVYILSLFGCIVIPAKKYE